MEKEACSNCRHSDSAFGYSSTALFSGSECHCRAPDFPWHTYRHYAYYRQYRHFESLMPSLCGHYEPRDAGCCPECGAPLGPVHLVAFWASGVFAVVPCCSPRCLAARQSRLDAEEATIAPVVGARTDDQEHTAH